MNWQQKTCLRTRSLREKRDFSDYELGTVDIRFAEEVEIVEVYLDDSQLTDVAQAAEEVIKEQEVNSVSEVVSGDTLSEIAIKTNIPMEQLVAMNDSLGGHQFCNPCGTGIDYHNSGARAFRGS